MILIIFVHFFFHDINAYLNGKCRRFVWNFFRLENEHLNNCGKFRAVRDISVAPLDSSDQNLLICMMDEPDGVINRRKKERKYPKYDTFIAVFCFMH